ncbi:MAG: beta-lactamase domain protein [Acidobacteria bacterium]|nr:beta-lactamase domain protein [Acidobacteriota bacterium]
MRMYARVRARAGAFAGAIGVVAGLAVPTLALPTLQAQQVPDLKRVLYNMADSLGMLRSVQEVDSLMTVEFWGSGTMREVGPKDVGPPVQIKSYYAQIAYDFPGMRVEITRASGTPAREIQVVSGTFAWNEIDKIGGGLVPGWGSAVPAMGTATDRLLRLWTTPFGVVKAAAAAGEQTKVTAENGAVVVTFPLVNSKPGQAVNMVVGELSGTPVKVTLDADSRPARVEVRHRNRVITTTYSNYGDLNEKDYQADIFLPARVVQTVDGQTVLDLTIAKSNTYNPYVIMPVPDAVQKAAAR